MKHLEKLVGDGVVTVDGNGVVRLTKSAWVTMTTSSFVTEEKVVRKHDFSKKEKDSD